MAKVTEIWINKAIPEIVVNWDNDRHQAIELKDRSPESVVNALSEMVELLKQEIRLSEI